MPNANEKVAGPLTDWLERTRNIPPEFWLDFSGSSGIDENAADLERGRTETKTKTDRMTVTSVEELAARSTDPVPNKMEITEPPPRRHVSKKGSVVKSSFLRFNLTPVESATQSIKPGTSSVGYYTGSERVSPLRPRTVTQDFGSKVISGSNQSKIRNQNQPKIEKTRQLSVRFGQVNARSVASTNRSQEQDLPELKGRPSKSSDQPEVKTARGPIEYSDPQVALNRLVTERSKSNSTNLFIQPRFDHPIDVPIPIASTHFEQSEKTPDSHTKSFDHGRNLGDPAAERTGVFTEAPWVALPDDFLPRSFEAGESSRSLTEHLLLLEREQAGNI